MSKNLILSAVKLMLHLYGIFGLFPQDLGSFSPSNKKFKFVLKILYRLTYAFSFLASIHHLISFHENAWLRNAFKEVPVAIATVFGAILYTVLQRFSVKNNKRLLECLELWQDSEIQRFVINAVN